MPKSETACKYTSRDDMSSAKDADSIPIADATLDPIEHAVPATNAERGGASF